jgi:hypothetical protein
MRILGKLQGRKVADANKEMWANGCSTHRTHQQQGMDLIIN